MDKATPTSQCADCADRYHGFCLGSRQFRGQSNPGHAPVLTCCCHPEAIQVLPYRWATTAVA